MASVAIYVRLSIEDKDKRYKTDESESIQNQKSMLREYCIERNWTIYDIYCDEDYSGSDSKRPEFNRMLKDCETGKIDVVLCKSQSRFSRDMEMIEKYIHNKFIEWGIRFISIIDRADSEDISNKKARQINGLINEWYLEDISENIRRTLKHKREQGEFTGSFAPYGYLIDPQDKNHLIIDNNVAPIVREIFNWYLQGWGYRKIAIELNNRNIPNPTSYKQANNSKYVNKKESKSSAKGLWTTTTIYRLIRNETYTGALVQGKSHNVSYKNKKRKSVPKEHWIRVPDCHEAIIDMTTWNGIQERLQSRTRTARGSQELSPFAGKLKCDICGAPMNKKISYSKDKKKTYYSFQCRSYKAGTMNCTNLESIGGIQLEDIIIEQINQLIQKYCQMEEIEIYDQQNDKIQAYEAMLSSVRKKQQDIEDKMLKLYEDKLDGIITKEQYILFSKKYNNEIIEFKEKCKNIATQIDSIRNVQKDLLNKKEFIKNHTYIDKLSKNVMDEFIEAVYIGKKAEDGNRKITIEWKV